MDFLDFDLLGQFLEDEFLDELFLVVFFFLLALHGFPLVLQALNSSDIVFVE